METVDTQDPAASTFSCSVVFVDLVGYARKTVTEQIAARDGLNRLLAAALGPIPAEGRIILDTEGGAAMSFLDDPEDALYAGMTLQKRIAEGLAGKGGPEPSAEAFPNLRIGINLGPVQIGHDGTGRASILGDGLDTAEQIMGFALPGQVATSKSFQSRVAKRSSEYAGLFRHDGSRTDRRVRDHEIYQLRWSDEALQHALASIEARKNPGGDATPAPAAAQAKAVPERTRAEPFGGLIDFLEDNTKVAFAAVVLGAVIVAQGILLYIKHVPGTRQPPPVAAQSPAPAAPPSVAPAPKIEPEPAAPITPTASTASTTSSTATAPAVTIAAAPVEAVPAQPVQPAPPKQETVAPPVKEAVKPTVRKADQEPTKPAARKADPEPAKPAVRKADPEPPKPAPRKSEAAKETRPAAPVAPPAATARPESGPTVPAAQPKQAASSETGLVPLVRTSVDFPKEAVREGISSGAVKARMAIDAAGNVTRVDVVESRPARVFDRAVKASLAKWKFAPGADGRSYEIEIDFRK